MRNIIIILVFFASLRLCAMSFSQQGTFLIPRQIFVGDPAMLVVPLPAAAQNSEDIVLSKLDSNFPQDPHIDFHRVKLERNTGASRLIIEFTAFKPGVLELPVIYAGGEFYGGLTISVNSLINEGHTPMLSAAAFVLAMPGTASLIYGLIALLVFFILATVWFVFRGKKVFRKLLEKWKRFKLFASIKKTERHLYKAATREDGSGKRDILDRLSEEFREFLSLYTGINCRSMTAREFDLTGSRELGVGNAECPVNLGNYFKFCDELRFSGEVIDTQNIIKLLDDLRVFVHFLEKPPKNEESA